MSTDLDKLLKNVLNEYNKNKIDQFIKNVERTKARINYTPEKADNALRRMHNILNKERKNNND